MKRMEIVFIHGWGGSKKEYQRIKNSIFKSRKNDVGFYEFEYKDNRGESSIDEITKEFHSFVEKSAISNNFIIIGISQGGIIARNYISKYSNKQVTKCFTVCSPHKGSLLAYTTNKRGAQDLRPKSPFLKGLEKAELKKKPRTIFYSVFTPFDLMVFPGWNAKFAKARKNIMVLSLAHPFAFNSKKTLSFIYKNLS